MIKNSLERFKGDNIDLTNEDDAGNFLVLLQYMFSLEVTFFYFILNLYF